MKLLVFSVCLLSAVADFGAAPDETQKGKAPLTIPERGSDTDAFSDDGLRSGGAGITQAEIDAARAAYGTVLVAQPVLWDSGVETQPLGVGVTQEEIDAARAHHSGSLVARASQKGGPEQSAAPIVIGSCMAGLVVAVIGAIGLIHRKRAREGTVRPAMSAQGWPESPCSENTSPRSDYSRKLLLPQSKYSPPSPLSPVASDGGPDDV